METGETRLVTALPSGHSAYDGNQPLHEDAGDENSISRWRLYRGKKVLFHVELLPKGRLQIQKLNVALPRTSTRAPHGASCTAICCPERFKERQNEVLCPIIIFFYRSALQGNQSRAVCCAGSGDLPLRLA